MDSGFENWDEPSLFWGFGDKFLNVKSQYVKNFHMLKVKTLSKGTELQ